MRQDGAIVCAIDTETHLISPGKLAPPLVCLSWCDGKHAGLLHRNEMQSKLEAFLKSRQFKIVGHNIAFDMAVIAQAFPQLLPAIFDAYDEDRIEDTFIREQLIDIASGQFRGVYRDENQKTHKREYSLASIARRRLKIELEKDDWRMRYVELTDTPITDWPEGAKDYARADAQATFEIFKDQESQIEILENSTAQAQAAFVLHLMSCWGVVTDQTAVERLETSLREVAESSRALMKQAGLLHANNTKNLKEIRGRVLDCLGKETPRTEKGSIKTDDKTLSRCNDSGLSALSEFKGAEKIQSTWIKHLKMGSTQPIQSHYSILVETGRTSCSKPNLQNPHRATGLRECFVPRKGYLYAACDFRSLEMCTLAQVCIWLFDGSSLADAINEGVDPHLLLASQIMSITYESAKDRMRSGDKAIRKTRQIAKAANFGYPGGMGAAKFREFASASGLDLSLPESERLRRNWFDAWPEMRKYFDLISSITKHPEAQLKHFVSNRYRGRLRFTSACNSYFQGLAADGAKAALYAVTRRCYTREWNTALFGSRPVMFIHDEIIAEVPERDAPNAADELSRVMRETMQRFVPDVTIGTSVALMRRWYKDAEEVRNKNGQLKIWER